MTTEWASKLKSEDEWRQQRRRGIGSSDIGIILGVSPYSTVYKLWGEKTGVNPSTFKGNWATERGTRLEPEIRDWYNKKYGYNAKPEQRTSEIDPVYRANCDGIDHDKMKLIEIKTAGKVDHMGTLAEMKVPEKYIPQLHWLMMVFDYSSIDYISYNDTFSPLQQYAVTTVHSDKDYTREMINDAKAFWKLVTDLTPPEADEQQLTKEDVDDLLTKYTELKNEESTIKKEIVTIMDQLKEKMTGPKAVYKDYTLSWVERKGNVDYSKIKELNGIKLEDYRKKSTTYMTIKRKKNEND